MTLTWLDIALILLCGVVIGTLYALHDRKKQKKLAVFTNNVLLHLPISFFYKPKKSGLPFCSKNLALSLNLTSQNISWLELLTHFDALDIDTLQQSFDDLEIHHTVFDTVVHSANRLFTFQAVGQQLGNGDILVSFQDISQLDHKSSSQQQVLNNQKNEHDILMNALETLPFPLFIRDQNGKNVFANPAVTQTAKSLNDMDWLSLPFESNQQFFTMTYGQETKTEEELKIILNKMTAAHRRLCQELPNPVCLFSAKGELIACSKSFAQLWHLDESWLKSTPSFEEYWDTVQEEGLLARVADFAGYKKQQRETFARLSQTSELFLYLPDGRLIKRTMIPYTQGSVILLDEITESEKK